MKTDEANSLLSGTADATSKPLHLVSKYSRSAEHASLFNYASMATNNHFFFTCLSPKKTAPSSTFVAEIDDSFSSYDTFRTEMIETADSMFGPGFVWVVKDQEACRMKLLCTYLSGSPYPEAHSRSQQVVKATGHRSISNTVGYFGQYSRLGNARSVDRYNARPVLCVSTWQHTYLRDYGVGGKREYLERWWDRIDWTAVENQAKLVGPQLNYGISNRLTSSFKRFGQDWKA
jgi:superoxide dismutase, Fe-Mn family